MPASVTLGWHGFDVAFDPSQAAVGLSRDGTPWFDLALPGVGELSDEVVDVDEVSWGYQLPDGVELRVRHSWGENWTLRVVLANGGAEPVRPQLPLRLALGPSATAWVWAAGVEGRVAVSPRHGAGPVVGFVVQHGVLSDEGGELSLVPPDLVLAPGGRWVTGLRAELFETGEGFASGYPHWFVDLDVGAGVPIGLRAPDWGLVAPESARVTNQENHWTEVSLPPGRHRLALHTPTGTARFTVSCGQSLTGLIRPHVVPTVGRGLASGAEAYLLATSIQQGLIRFQDVGGALSRFVPRPDDLLGIAALVTQARFSAGVDAVRAALDLLAEAPVVLGYGRVVLKAWLAGLAEGIEEADHAQRLLERPADSELAAFELSLLTVRSAEVAGPTLVGLVNALGGRMAGEPLGLPAVVQAQLVSLLRLVPEEWAQAGEVAATLAKTQHRLSAGLVDRADPATLAWLLLAEELG